MGGQQAQRRVRDAGPGRPCSTRTTLPASAPCSEATLLGWADADPDAAKQAADLTAQGAKELDRAKRARSDAQISKLLVERSPHWTFLPDGRTGGPPQDHRGVTFTPSTSPIDWKYLTKQ